MEQSPVSEPIQNKPAKANAWLRIMAVGFLFYIIAVVLLYITANPNLFPTVVMIGSFLVPISYVAFFYERGHLSSNLTLSTTLICFVFGGILGVLAASLLEPIFIRQIDFVSTIAIGLIEEFTKILGVIIIARHRRHDSEMNGLILGAAAGMGFAALESTGYAFTSFLASGGSLDQTVIVTLLRSVLSPIGHGTWTAILASVIFRESVEGRFRINFKVFGAYLLVSALHGLWDGLPSVITTYLGAGLDVFVGEAIIGGLGLFILWLLWRESWRVQVDKTE